MTLIPSSVNPGARPPVGFIDLQGVYAHLDRWVVEAQGSCSWGAAAIGPATAR